jgi:polyhydroxybutyrate depolymerase
MTTLFLAAILAADPTLRRVEVTVDGVVREALVSIPEGATKEKPAPVVFAFHGHGGTMRNAARTFGFEKRWPEAVVVYMQGLKTASMRDPEGLKFGWQNRAGAFGDRDVKAFDAMLTLIKTKTVVDETRLYATGHSNGGGFTYALWSAKPELFAAIAPSSANPPLVGSFKPIPAFHVTGRTDAVVSYEGQVRTVESLRKINGCDEKGDEWAKDCTLYASTKGAPVVWMVHDGGHKYSEEAPGLIVRFFKDHARKVAMP